MAGSHPGHAQSSDVNNRLDRIENELETMSRAVYRGDVAPPNITAGTAGANAAGVEVRLQDIEDQMRTLNGKLEEQNYQVDQLKTQLEKNNTDIDLRLQALEHGGAAASPAATIDDRAAAAVSDPTSETAPAETVPDLVNGPPQPATPAKQLGELSENPATGAVSGGGDQAAADYEAAYALLKANNYDAAEKAFADFLKKYPGHVLGPNAKYWYGETFYARAQYDKAARVFAEGYQADMKGSKAGDNLLKLGMSLAGMGNKNDACVAFRQLKKEGSKISAPVISRTDQEMSKLGC